MILDQTFPPDPRVENEARVLAQAGFEVFLFCVGSVNEVVQEPYEGFKLCRYPYSKLTYKLSALSYTIPWYRRIMVPKLKHFIKENKITHLHVHDIRIAAAVDKANKKKLPVVLDLHDNYPEIMKLYPHLNKFPGKYIINPKKWKDAEAVYINKAEKVITVSPDFVKELQGRFPELSSKFVLVPNTISRSFYTEYKTDQSIVSKTKEKFNLLYLGDTGLRRGLLTAIRAVKIIKTKIPEIHLTIVGSNSTDDVLKAEVKKLGLEKYISMEGWQDVSLFPSYILGSDVCISPLDRNIQHDVAYANKLFQYMGFSKPLLVSDAIAQKNLVQEIGAGLVHRERNPEDFAAQLMKLYEDAALRSEMGEKGFEFIDQTFNWETSSTSLINLYKGL